MKALLTASLLITLGLLIATPSIPTTPSAPWAEEALSREADYIVNCSFTEFTGNNGQVQPADDAYGAENDLRIFDRGPDWVRPGEAAMTVIGLMAAARQLHAAGRDVTRYDQVLDRFFRVWLLTRHQPINTDPASGDYGGFFERVYYDATGKRVRKGNPNAGVTGQMIAAMWKYYEYNLGVGRTQAAREWLQQGWTDASRGAEFIRRNFNPTYRLVRSNARTTDLWVSDSTYAVMALRCLHRWAVTAEKTEPFDYPALADKIVGGLQELKDDRHIKNFYRYREGSQSHRLTYGDRIDQLCFLPYEADVLNPGEAFAKAVSDWWTEGSDNVRMTFQTADPSDWRYYGTRLRHSFAGAKQTSSLYPGAALQLAKVEWKHAARTGDSATLDRARKRLEWVRSAAFSNLWLGASGATEANTRNGIVDWRDTTDYSNTAGSWARFSDTSAAFIEVVLMLEYGIDTKYVPN
jgi:hypothetical protein